MTGVGAKPPNEPGTDIGKSIDRIEPRKHSRTSGESRGAQPGNVDLGEAAGWALHRAARAGVR